MQEQTLFEQLASVEHLTEAWNLLNRENENSCGLSGVTIHDFEQNLEQNIYNLSREIQNEQFCFSPYKAYALKKDNGKYRPLQIPEIKDRVVLKAIALLLEKELEDIFKKSTDISFAYQKGKGVREAILQMKSVYQKGHVILKVDIINFFEEVKKDILLDEMVFPHLRDTTINGLIKKALHPVLKGIPKKHKSIFSNVGKGLPQGNPLSPLLSNVYLSGFDSFVQEAGCTMVRYADDFIVFLKSEEEARTVHLMISQYLKEKYCLNIHSLEDNSGKTLIVNPNEKEFTFLSIKFDGVNIYPSKKTVNILKGKLKKCIKSNNGDKDLVNEIYIELKKWIAIYSYLDIDRYFETIDSYLDTQLQKKFGKDAPKIKKCKNVVTDIRTKQYNKSTLSFWRNLKWQKILPQFVTRKFKGRKK